MLALVVVVAVAREMARAGKSEVERVVFVLLARAVFVSVARAVVRAVARAVARVVTMAVRVAGSGNGGGFGGGSGSGKGKGRGVCSGGAVYIIVPVKIILIYRNFSYMKST